MLDDQWNQIITASRNSDVKRMTVAARQRLAQIYISEINNVYARLGSGQIPAEAVPGMIADLQRALVRAGISSEVEIKRMILRTAQLASGRYESATATMAQLTGAAPASSFDQVPTRAVERLFVKREMDLVRSFKSISPMHSNVVIKQVDEALKDAFKGGADVNTTVAQLAKALVSQDEHAKAAVEKFGTGPQLLKWARSAPDSPSKGLAKAAGTIGYNARRIARTEIRSSYHEASIEGARGSNIVRGQKWNLSPRHPKPDICDAAARLDLYGLGPGVYPVGMPPPHLHPHDLCYLTDELRDSKDWDKPMPKSGRAMVVRPEMAASVMRGATANAISKATSKLNHLNTLVYASEQSRPAA